jgi:hypothetical protein
VREYIKGRQKKLRSGASELVSLSSKSGAKKSVEEKKIGKPNFAKSFSRAAFAGRAAGNLLIFQS